MAQSYLAREDRTLIVLIVWREERASTPTSRNTNSLRSLARVRIQLYLPLFCSYLKCCSQTGGVEKEYRWSESAEILSCLWFQMLAVEAPLLLLSTRYQNDRERSPGQG